MEEHESEKKAEKRAKSEAQRIASIRAKQELEKQRKAILSQALRAVDQKSKRVVFPDSDDEDNPPSSSQADSQKSSAGHVKLFEDSSSDEDEEAITITNRHEGKKGEKLMKLEARFNSDSRFKLDEKFVSSGSEDEEDDEVVQERTKQLEVLSKVLGSTVKPQKKTLKSSEKNAKGHAKVRPFTRFDPFNEEHVRWLKKQEEAGDDVNDDDNNEESAVDENEGEQKTNGIHYEMQPDFAEELKVRLAAEASTAESSQGSAGFSFLAMVGRKAASEEKRDAKQQEVDIVPNKKLKKFLNNGDNEDDGIDANVVAPASLSSAPLGRLATGFFVTGNEEHLQSLVRNFRRTQPLERIVPLWGNHRDVFAKNYKHLRKAALKEKRENPMQNNGKNKERKGKTFPTKANGQVKAN